MSAAILREKAGDGSTDFIVEIRQGDLRALLDRIDSVAAPPDYQRDYLLVRQALLRRHDLDPDGVYDQETDDALRALDALCVRAGL